MRCGNKLDIRFKNDKFRKECNEQKALVKSHGPKRARLIQRRLDDLTAAETLEVMRVLPGRCHELKADREGQLSIDLDGPYRLIFTPAHNPLPKKQDGGIDWSKITAITILEIVDTHG